MQDTTCTFQFTLLSLRHVRNHPKRSNHGSLSLSPSLPLSRSRNYNRAARRGPKMKPHIILLQLPPAVSKRGGDVVLFPFPTSDDGGGGAVPETRIPSEIITPQNQTSNGVRLRQRRETHRCRVGESRCEGCSSREGRGLT